MWSSLNISLKQASVVQVGGTVDAELSVLGFDVEVVIVVGGVTEDELLLILELELDDEDEDEMVEELIDGGGGGV